MTMTCEQWKRTKFALLTRLPDDYIQYRCSDSCNPNYLPFLQKTYDEGESGSMDLSITPDSIDVQSQEVKMLQLNEASRASDTQQVAIASGYGTTWQNATKKL